MSTAADLFLAYLANSVWQAALFYAAALLALRAGRRWTPQNKHRIWVLTFLAQVLVPAICLVSPAFIDSARQTLLHLLGWEHRTAHSNIQVVAGEAHTAQPGSIPHAILWTVVALYTASIAFFVVRLGYQLLRVRLLSYHSRPALLSRPRQERWEALRAQACLPRADLRLSSEVPGPVTIGVLHKRLLMPARFLDISQAELDAAFAHELAHMRRNDYAKNLGYELLFLFAAYHPCVRLTRRALAESREMVCDAEAARALDGAEPYVHALLRLAAFCLPHQLAVPTQAIGIFDVNTLERRLMSLKACEPQASWKQRLATASAGIVLLFAASASALAFRVGVPTPTPQSEQTAPANVLRIPSGVMAGQVVSKVPPVYPEEAKQARIMGSVVLSATIGTDGHIANLTVLSGPPELQTSALDAVRQWIYKPYLLNGDPVQVQTTITVNYQLAD